MRLWPGFVTGMVAAGALLVLVTPFEGATKKKPAPKRRAAAPQVSASAKSASLRKVSEFLEDSPRTIAQPGALVPVFEQLMRLGAADKKAPVHIIHFGDSHTAADDWSGGLRDLFKE